MKVKKWKDIKKLTKSVKQEEKKPKKPEQTIDVIAELWIEDNIRFKEIEEKAKKDLAFLLNEFFRLRRVIIKLQKKNRELEKKIDEQSSMRLNKVQLLQMCNDAHSVGMYDLKDHVYSKNRLDAVMRIGLGLAFLKYARMVNNGIELVIAGIFGICLILRGLIECAKE